MDQRPRQGGELVAAYCVGEQVGGVYFEIHPVVDEALDEAEDGFAVEGVDAVAGGLVEEGDDGVAEDEGDEGVGSFGAVFDVDGGCG